MRIQQGMQAVFAYISYLSLLFTGLLKRQACPPNSSSRSLWAPPGSALRESRGEGVWQSGYWQPLILSCTPYMGFGGPKGRRERGQAVRAGITEDKDGSL